MAPDITNPGVVEIASQGYPKAPDGGSPAPTNSDSARVADQAMPPASLDSVSSADPAPPLNPILPANQGNPLGLPDDLTIPAPNPIPLTDVQDVNVMTEGGAPVNPRAFLISQAGSIAIDSAESIQESVIGFSDAAIDIIIVLSGSTFAALTAGNLVIRFFCSDGVVAQTTLSLAALQALGAVATATVPLFPPIFGRTIVGTQTIVTAFQGPGLLSATFTVQRTGDPVSYNDGELVPLTDPTISQTVNVGVQGAVTNLVIVTDNETGGLPNSASVNLRLTFQMPQSFLTKGISLAGRPVDFEAIDANREIAVMAAFYLVIPNFNANGESIVRNIASATGVQLGALVSFDTARYAGETISQVDPTVTQNVVIDSGPPTGVPPIQVSIGAPAFSVNPADQVLVNGTPINILP